MVNKDEYDPIDLFGHFYATDPTSFQFLPGERQLIKSISIHVMRKIDEGGENNNIDYFRKNECIDNGVKPKMKKKNQQEIAKETMANKSLTHFFLGRLIDTANANSKKRKNGYRYDVDIRRFATYLRMIVGPLGYETIQRNLECAIPSLPTTNRYVQKSSCHVTEGVLRCRELLLYLNERNAPLVVSLSEDATRIVGRPQYDSKTNQIIGFVPPLDIKNRMPVPYAYPARTADEMISHFSNKNPIASNVNVIMAQPIGPDYIAPFCLLLFGSDDAYTSIDVQSRWVFIINELNKLNIRVLAVASDSDPKYNSSMKKLSGLGCQSNLFKNMCPNTDWFKCGTLSIDRKFTLFIQDPVHIATKLRNLFLKTIRQMLKLKFGEHYIQCDHLKQLIERFSKDKHRLTPNVINPVDKQNFQSAKRICDQSVIDLLINNVPGSQGTAKFLELMQNMIVSYLDVDLSPLERIYKLWYSVFLIRIWRLYVLSNKALTLKYNFLSTYSYYCIELNAHSMVHCLVGLKESPELFKPHLYDSQTCESTFRQIRSLSSVYSTVTNCTTKEISERMKKIQLQNDIIASSCPSYIFPKLGRTRNEHDSKSVTMPTIQEIYDEIERSKKDALLDAIHLGLITEAAAESYNFSCEIKPYVKPRSKRGRKNNKSRSITKGRDIKNRRNIKRFLNCRNINIKNVKNSLRLRSITLKNNAEMFEGKEVEENSPYVEVYRSSEKRIVVKKTSFCWLLRRDCDRLSSDRLERVRAYSKHAKRSGFKRL